MAKYDKIPDDHLLTRWIRRKFLARDDENNVIVDEVGNPKHIFPQAFCLRDGEDALSLTDVDFFDGDAVQKRWAAVEAVRLSQASQKLSDSDAFCFSSCGQVIACCKSHGSKVRVIEDPVDGNDAHCLVASYPDGLGMLQEELATLTFSGSTFYSALK